MVRLAGIAALLVLVLGACGNSAAKQPAAKPPSIPTATPTPTRPAPALVQIENAPDSRPQSGIQKADLVYEYLTEGGISRLSVIYFNPSGGERIEPVRSARLVSLRLLTAYQAVLFYSGASDHVLGKIYAAGLPNFDEKADGGKYYARDGSRQAPHNLYTSGDQLKAGVEKSGKRVTYELPAPAEPAGQGDPVRSFSFAQTYAHSLAYTYSDADRAYTARSETGPVIDAANGGQPVRMASVVLLRVAHHGMGYTEDVAGAEGIDFDLQGTGPADVYTRGQHFSATWDLTQPAQPLKLLGPGGAPLSLPQGLTWIDLVDPETQVASSSS